MAWLAADKDRKAIELIMSMCTGALLGNGVDTRNTFVTNLEMMVGQMKGEPQGADKDRKKNEG